MGEYGRAFLSASFGAVRRKIALGDLMQKGSFRTGTALLVLAALWVALAIAAVLTADASRETRPIEDSVRATHERAARIPYEEFKRDRANRLEGRVVRAEGHGLGSVSVELFDFDAILAAISETVPGRWPRVEPERVTETAPSGDYSFTHLAYGSKVVLFRHPGSLADQRSEIVLSDGYGASEIDATLRPTEPLSLAIREAGGTPVAFEAVRFLPRAFGCAEVVCRTDSEGLVSVPEEARSTLGEPFLLIGEPPVALAGPASPEGRELEVPPARPLELLIVDGVRDGPLDATLFPEGARRAGRSTLRLDALNGRVTIPGIRLGRYEILLEQEGRVGRVVVGADGGPARVRLRERSDLAVRVHDDAKLVAGARVEWQSVPFAMPHAFERDALPWVESAEPTRTVAVSNDEGVAEFASLPTADGWLRVSAHGHVPVILECAAEERRLEIHLRSGTEISVRTSLSYLPILVEPDSGIAEWKRSDAAREAFVWALDGPLVARAGFHLGGKSYPVGLWVGAGGDDLRVTIADDRGRPGGCVFGFVSDHRGEPSKGAEVFLAREAGSPLRAESSESGFYRFAGLAEGAYRVMARRKDDEDTVIVPREVDLRSAPGRGEGDERCDLVLWQGSIEIEPDPERADGVLEIRRPDESLLWSGALGKDRFRLTHLPPGSYRATLSDPVSGIALGEASFAISKDDERTFSLTLDAKASR